MKQLSLVMCALAVAVPSFAEDASGKWQLTVTTSDREPRTTSLSLKKEGDKLSGTMMGLQGNEIAVAGTQRESDITLSFTAPTPERSYRHLDARTAGWGFDEGDASGRHRDAGAVDRRADGRRQVPSAVDLTGTWAFEVLTPPAPARRRWS